MYLKSLELSGFKSFAKKASLSFSTPITAIVGPNGSGKSNIAEAFRFALGEQSIKSMRGKRTEDLIWNGSGSAPKSNRASVKLTFDNTLQGDRRLFDIDFDEVVLERIIHRDASSEYLLNGSPVRLKDTMELLSAAHIGSSGHHIISQGEADRILSVNPRERKGMVEDALGLKAYHYKKEEALRKLEKTRENLEKIESIRREIRPHLRFLEKQVEKVAKARELAADLVEAYREYFAREKFYLETERKRLERELSPKKRRADELQKEIERARAELQKLSEKGTESDDLLHAEEAMRHARDEKDEAVRDVGRIEGEIRALETLIVREEKKASEDAHRTVPFSSVASFSQSLLTRLSDAERTQDLSVLKKLFGELKSAVVQFVETLSGQSHASQEELRELKGRLAELSAKKDALSRAVEDIEKRETEREREYKNIQHTIEQDIHSGRDMERAIFSLSNEQQEVRMSLQTLEGALSSLALEDEEYARELLEAGALAGRQAVQFDDVFKTLLAADAVAPRGEQHERKRHIEKQKVRLEDAGSGTGEDIMKEYDDVRERDAFLEKEVTDLTASTDSLGTLIADLNETLAREFAHGIEKINEQFSSFFSLMFGGGTASLAVTKEIRRARRDTDVSDSEEAPEEEVPEAGEEGAEVVVEGVEIHVSLPRKKIRGLEMLSGGERALTSIALIFAMSQVNPPPFIILDETDAALDEANSRRYGDMIENLAAKTQLILITHNRETMSRAGVLYGVTMGQDAVSQLLSVSFSEAVAVAK